MRWYFSFGYGFKKIGIACTVGDDLKEDLVGYGYDEAPILRSITIHIIFFEFVIGSLIMVKL